MVYLKALIKLFVLITDVVRHDQCYYQWAAGTCLSTVFKRINREFSYLKTWWIPSVINIPFWDKLNLQYRTALTLEVFNVKHWVQMLYTVTYCGACLAKGTWVLPIREIVHKNLFFSINMFYRPREEKINSPYAYKWLKGQDKYDY